MNRTQYRIQNKTKCHKIGTYQINISLSSFMTRYMPQTKHKIDESIIWKTVVNINIQNSFFQAIKSFFCQSLTILFWYCLNFQSYQNNVPFNLF